ncbi:hypothetical protein BGZ57DRAFT_751790 [Hyaloscypha finlandica]|nr:hypothetical protein BGZ57DRAFT_751790 [Hyaloscypha finlandica]
MPSRTEDTPPPSVPIPLKPLAQFKRLSPTVWLYTPPNYSTTSQTSSLAPTTILLCSWMNAVPKHTAYYANTYMTLYPQARIILVTINTMQFLFHPEIKRRADIKAAVTALLAADQSTDRLLIHALSNGGNRRVYNISSVYRSLTGNPLPAKIWIVDSAGGIPQFRRDIHALQVPARQFSWFVWIPYMAFAYTIVSVVYVTVNWMPEWFWYELVWGPYKGNNDPRLVDGNCVKGYVYSKEDEAMDWRDTERHARVAEEKGYRVVMKLIEGAGHVQMFRGKGGEQDYWGFIEKIWKLGVGFK